MEKNIKKIFLEKFNQIDYQKCSFKLIDGTQCQGWIVEIFDDTFEYLDSGPLAREERYFFKIEMIDLDSFSFFDEKQNIWIDYKD